MTTKEKGKRKSIVMGCGIVLLSLLVVLAVGGAIGWSLLSREHREARSLPLNAVDFDRLKDDGVFHGVYEGGMYRWRFNECEVTVTNGRVTGIQLIASNDPSENFDYATLYDRVIEEQSLQVDTISSATLTSKGHLQCIENALLAAQQQ